MRPNYAIGVDVGGTRIAAGLVERKGRIVKDAKRLTPHSGPFAVVDTIIDLIEEVSVGIQPAETSGIGIGLPAQIDFLKQSVEFCTNLPLAGVDVRSLVMSRTKHEVTIDNDGNLAAYGEARYGAAKGARDFLMITLGTGVGGGLFVNGEPYRGSRGMGGEIGHVVIDLDGPPCPCGGRGHLESFLGRPAIAAKGVEAAKEYKGSAILQAAGGDASAITAEAVILAAGKGDDVARSILLEAGEILGRGLVGFVNVLNPKLIVVGGGVGESAPFVMERAAEVMQSEALAGRRDVKVVHAVLGNDAGILGAASLAFDEHDSREGLHR
ncbi:MAG TPA: ROK family protein [Coriobacteriia bacterium]|nr:ROK family protein [Coriobacteriia bacterium]